MGIFLNSAYEILRTEKRPLSARNISQLACERGLLRSSGKTPWQTMKAKLSVDILRKGPRSVFMRTAKGEFALREWSSTLSEHVADRYQKALFDEDIVVFPAESLSKYVPEVGLYMGDVDHRSLIDECYTMRRRLAEAEQAVIQLVSVFVVRHGSRILTYKRTKRLPENRLHGYYSAAFGGHLNPDDALLLFNIFDAEQGQPMLMRELFEELRVEAEDLESISYVGLLYDNSREVSKQHLGLVYDVNLKKPVLTIGERGFLMDPKYETVAEIQARIDQFENWSSILVKECQYLCSSSRVASQT